MTNDIKMHRAAHLLAEWIKSEARFDLTDIADRLQIVDELEFLKQEYYELLYDDINNEELSEFYYAQVPDVQPNWIRQQFDRIFNNN